MPQLQHQRILVVDDDDDTRLLCQVLLESEGATVQTVGSVAEALTFLTRREVDVLLTDIAMPEADGWTLLDDLRRSGRPELQRLPVIAITAVAELKMAERAKRAGCAVCLFKPIDVEELIATVVQILSGKIHRLETAEAPVWLWGLPE